ncbi:MAG: ATP-binding protein [Ruminococcaceae bacterium]|nr:ATP-binding protein [Oscillospiraceae bacterium]
MLKEVSKLLIYSDLGGDSILENLARIIASNDDKDTKIRGIYREVKRILDLATSYGFDTNLWQNYLTFLLITNENSFSLTCERKGASDGGSVNLIAKQDFRIFKNLFHYDFSKVEEELGINCFSVITNYSAIAKREQIYNKTVSAWVRALSEKIAAAKNEDEVFDLVTEHYKKCGVGMLGMNRAFRIVGSGKTLEFCPINNASSVRLSDIVGYESQKAELAANTEAFVNGGKGNNALLYGDSGTGKSTSIKAVLNEYFDAGLRMIEIYKHQFRDLGAVISLIKNRNYRFIIYIDDLSFEDYEIEYKFLKAVIEGGVEERPDNILIYATSNRRHLIKETWNDRNDMEFKGEIHHSDTVEEKLSLSSRFGVLINYSSPAYDEYLNIVRTLAKREDLDIEDEELVALAKRWEIRHGGVSGRAARQFIDYLTGKGNK